MTPYCYAYINHYYYYFKPKNTPQKTFVIFVLSNLFLWLFQLKTWGGGLEKMFNPPPCHNPILQEQDNLRVFVCGAATEISHNRRESREKCVSIDIMAIHLST